MIVFYNIMILISLIAYVLSSQENPFNSQALQFIIFFTLMAKLEELKK